MDTLSSGFHPRAHEVAATPSAGQQHAKVSKTASQPYIRPGQLARCAAQDRGPLRQRRRREEHACCTAGLVTRCQGSQDGCPRSGHLWAVNSSPVRATGQPCRPVGGRQDGSSGLPMHMQQPTGSLWLHGRCPRTLPRPLSHGWAATEDCCSGA